MGYYDQNRSADNVAVRTQGFPGPGLNSVGEFQQSGRPYLIQAVNTGTHTDGKDDDSTWADDGVKVKDDDTSIEFPFVTKKVIVQNTSASDLHVYFCSLMVPAEDLDGADSDENDDPLDPSPTTRGNKLTTAELEAYNGGSDNRPNSAVLDNGHYYTVPNNQTLELNVKCRRIYFGGSGTDAFSVAAEMTNIVHPYNCDLRGIDGISGGTAGSITE